MKDWLTGIVAILALVVSIVSAYFTNFRLTDDIRVVFSLAPFVVINDKGTMGVSGEQEITFIDSGNRDVAVTGITLVLYKLRVRPLSDSDYDCDKMAPFQVANLVYDFEPFILKPGEIVVKKLDQTLFPEFWKNDSVDTHLKNFVLGGSVFGKGDTVFTCLRMSVTTPGLATDHVLIPKHHITITDVPHNGPAASNVSLIGDFNKPYSVIHTTTTLFND